MIRWELLSRAWRLRHDKARIGDLALLKSNGLGASIDPRHAAAMDLLKGQAPPIDLALLRRLPDGSFGRAYAAHMDDCDLMPFAPAPNLVAELRDNVFALRYPYTHDMYHVLLGYDVSWAGEIGVLGFAAAQRTSRTLTVAFCVACILYPILSPRTALQIWRNARVGRARGRRAPFLLSVKLEDCFEQPLAMLRHDLGL